MKKYDVAGIGESLIDFLSDADGDELTLTGHAGGAPPNVLAAAAKLGRSCCHISKVGDDAAGRFFLGVLSKYGIDTSGVLVDGSGALTTLAVVSLDDRGERSFVFYNEKTADTMLASPELPLYIIEDCRILHFGTVVMPAEPARSANLRAAEIAKASGAKISFDPNYRDFLWTDRSEAVSVMRDAMRLADYVKLSDEEAVLISGVDDPRRAAEAIFAEYSPSLLAVTLGAEGSIGMARAGAGACAGGGVASVGGVNGSVASAGSAGPSGVSRDVILVTVPSYDVKAVDTTGAGDGFWGAMLHRLLLLSDGTDDSGADNSGAYDSGMQKPLTLGEGELKDMLAYANAAGALAATKQGGIPAMPSDAEIRSLIAANL